MSKLRISYDIIGGKTYYQEVSSVEEAKLITDSIAHFVNFQVENNIFPDHCSAVDLEVWDEKENKYIEWYDEEGHSFDDCF